MNRRILSVRAFTLIELLVAIAVFAVLATLAYGVLNQTLANAEMMRVRMDRLKAVQRTMRVIGDDFFQLAPRPVRRDVDDGLSASLSTDYQSVYAIELTRNGWSNPLVMPRSSLQRAGYRIEENKLMRYHWTVLDRTIANEPIGEELLDEVDAVAFRFLQANGEWTEQWPPGDTPGPIGARLRPRAVEVVLTLASEGDISRLIEVAP